MQNFIAIQSYRLKWTSLILKRFRVAHIKQFLDTSIAICLWTLPVATQWSYWHVNANTLIGAVILFSSLSYIYTMLRAHNTCTCAPTTNSHNSKWWQVPLEPSADVSRVAAAMISTSKKRYQLCKWTALQDWISYRKCTCLFLIICYVCSYNMSGCSSG